ncbi:MAG TPA: YceH family protein [Paraburkholderia sp.]|nr:YceH family protein [Paraburkholderia sp.]
MNSTVEDSPRPALRELTPLEARVLGVLFEKQHTVPDTYPLSLNALTLGCNQKTSRSPVMNVSEAEVLSALESLKRLSLVFEGSSSRVPRFEHNLERVLGVPRQAAALLTALLLRGPQTAAELRLATARLHSFADTSSVEAFLDELAARDRPYALKLPRTPGERESRWVHLLCGDVHVGETHTNETAQRSYAEHHAASDELEALRADYAALSGQVARLEALVARMAAELGIATDGDEAEQSAP